MVKRIPFTVDTGKPFLNRINMSKRYLTQDEYNHIYETHLVNGCLQCTRRDTCKHKRDGYVCNDFDYDM